MSLKEVTLYTGYYSKSKYKKNYIRSRRPGGQTDIRTSARLQDRNYSWLITIPETKTTTVPSGIVVGGYYLGTFEFDSLTGHPGIRY